MYGGKLSESFFFLYCESLSIALQEIDIDIHTLDLIQICEKISNQSHFTSFFYPTKRELSFFYSIAESDSRIQIIPPDESNFPKSIKLGGPQIGQTFIDSQSVNHIDDELQKQYFIIGYHPEFIKSILIQTNLTRPRIILIQIYFGQEPIFIGEELIQYVDEIVKLDISNYQISQKTRAMQTQYLKLRKHLHTLLKDSKIKDAIIVLHKHVHTRESKHLIFFESRLSRATRDEKLGKISRDTADSIKSQIIDAILDYIDDLNPINAYQ